MAKKKAGTEGSDSWTGTNKAEFYVGLGGEDTISGMGGNDKLKGGDGNDGILGGEGNDKIWGDAGFDIIDAGAGKDVIRGGADTDSFIFRVGGKFGLGSDTDIIKDLDVDGEDMDHIQLLSLDPSNIIDSFADVMKHARQIGDDVRLDFGSGDVLILENVAKASLTAELFLL